MRSLSWVLLTILLAFPQLSNADATSVPGSANWYFYIDLAQMRSGGPGGAIYDWLRGEVFDEVNEESGLDVEKELNSVTSYSSAEDSGVLIMEGSFSQDTRDIVMAFIASGGDLKPLKSSGKTYYHFGGDETIDEDVSFDAGNVAFDIDSLGDEAWISMAIKNKVIVTSTESHMKSLLKNNGKLSGQRAVKGALLVLTAEKALLQAGVKADAIGADDWDSNILRNAEEIALLVAAKADKLAIEAKLITSEPEMAQSLASVARGLISLASFDDSMDAETASVLQGTKVQANGNSLTLSLAINADLVVSTLRD